MSRHPARPEQLPLGILLLRHRNGVATALVLSVATAASAIGLLGVSGWFITGAALTPAGMAFNLFGPSALVRALSFSRILSRYGEKLVGHDVSLRMLAAIRDWTMRRLIPLVPLSTPRWRHGELAARLVADLDTLQGAFIAVAGPAAGAIASGAGMGSLLMLLLPASGPPFALGYAAATLLVPALVIGATRRTGRELVEDRAALRVAVLQAIDGHGDLLACDLCGTAIADVADLAADLSRTGHRQATSGALGSAAVLLAGGLTMLAVFWAGLDATHRGEMSAPLLVGLVLATLASFEGAMPLVRSSGALGAALAAKGRVEAMIATPRDAAPARRTQPLPEGAGVSFDRVSFVYRPERTVFEDVSFTCLPGSRTAVVGESGGGKSTLFHLLLGLAVPVNGTITVAGTDIAAVDPADLRRRVTLMSQATPVFLGTIGDNLRLGRPDADDAALWRALGQARLDEFVASLPDKLETWCDQDGRTLSAGQARRLCLARALLTAAPILLLDEPTSGLDRATERDFLADLAGATGGRTVLVATHAALPAGAVETILMVGKGNVTRTRAS